MHVHSPIFPGKLIENNLDRNLQFTKNSSTYLKPKFHGDSVKNESAWAKW